MHTAHNYTANLQNCTHSYNHSLQYISTLTLTLNTQHKVKKITKSSTSQLKTAHTLILPYSTLYKQLHSHTTFYIPLLHTVQTFTCKNYTLNIITLVTKYCIDSYHSRLHNYELLHPYTTHYTYHSHFIHFTHSYNNALHTVHTVKLTHIILYTINTNILHTISRIILTY